ncbi:MAG: hypothetical protein IJA36_04335 [Lachnospiraceae bacterium]|nr:hypothetical protein [Lachnospiraceae bacterium]
MRRVIGFASFFVAVGMVITLFIPNGFIFFIIVVGLLLLGYNMFCC